MLRIGVVAPRQPSTVGGGFNFLTTVLHALNEAETDHRFMLLDLRGTGAGDLAGNTLQYVDANDIRPSGERTVDREQLPTTALTARFAAAKLGLDIVWYLDPLAEVLPIPVFATVLDLAHRQHPFFPEVSTKGWKWEERERHYAQVLPRAARVFVGTPTGKEQVIRCYGLNPASVVVNPFPVPRIATPEASQADVETLDRFALSTGFLFYPAQFWPHKNHVNLLLALKRLDEAHGLAPKLVLTGSDAGNQVYIQQVAKDLGLQDRVIFTGFVSQEEIQVFYRNAAALVFPSLFGPDNLPPLEAFALGCPVLAGRIEGVEEQLGDSSALYFDPLDPADIAETIAELLSDGARRVALVENGRRLADERSPKAYVDRTLSAINEFEPWRRNWPASGT